MDEDLLESLARMDERHVPPSGPALAFKVRWRQANGEWYVVDEDNGEIHAKALRQTNGLWVGSVFGVLRNTYWAEGDAKKAVEKHLDWAGARYEFVKD